MLIVMCGTLLMFAQTQEEVVVQATVEGAVVQVALSTSHPLR
jgi:hypothetical protein